MGICRLMRFDWRYRSGKRMEAAIRWMVWRLPRSVAYWSYIRVGAHATTGQFRDTVVPDISMTEALQRWDVR